MKLINIYIIKLQKDKYYIGKSNEPVLRYYTHCKGKGSSWTKKYKPISLKVIYNIEDEYLDLYVKFYMFKYGINNVRGGSYIEDKLSNEIVLSLESKMKDLEKFFEYINL